MSTPWRLAKSLVVLRDEIEARYPGTTVWTIGDQSHQSGPSDHNLNGAGVVCAIDVKADGGMDLGAFAEHLKEHPTRAVKYVIYDRRIWSKARNGEGWRNYHGKNPHTTHVHVSVGVGPDGRSTGPYDDTSPWGIASIGHGSAPSGIPTGIYREGDSGWGVERLQSALNRALGAGLDVDGDFGPHTAAAVRELQTRAGITTDGIYGDDSEDALRDLLEDDMRLDDQLDVTGYTTDRWGRDELDVETALSHTYTYARNASDYASRARTEQAAQTALLKQIAAGQSGLSEEAIAAAVADGVKRALPDVSELAAAVAEAVDHDLDTAAVEEALRRVLGGVDEAA